MKRAGPILFLWWCIVFGALCWVDMVWWAVWGRKKNPPAVPTPEKR